MPSTSNGVESVHRSANRDGTSLSLLAGINHGRQHDARQIATTAVIIKTNVQATYVSNDAYKRTDASFARSGESLDRSSSRNFSKYLPPAVRASKKGTAAANEQVAASKAAQAAVMKQASAVVLSINPPPAIPQQTRSGRTIINPTRTMTASTACTPTLEEYEGSANQLQDHVTNLERLKREELEWRRRGSKGIRT